MTRPCAGALFGVGVAAVFSFPLNQAQAEQTPGFYVGGAVGPSLLATQATTLDVLMGVTPATRVPVGKTQFDTGFGFAASAGYALGNGLRYEVEADFRRNTQSGAVTTGQTSGSGGTETKYGLFVNALYDADVGLRWVSPYIGIGLGFQIAQWGNAIVTGIGDTAQGNVLSASVGGSTVNFAYQIIAGLAFPVDYVTGLSVTAEYRFSGLIGARGYSGVASSASAGPFTARTRSSGETSHTFLVGLRYAFDAVPDTEDQLGGLPPAPIQQPAASRTYIVYFDIGSVDLTPHTRDVIAEAARASGRVAFTRIEVSGHTDRAGSAEHNIVLSRQRSDAVADEMVRWGILRSAIDIHAFGEERPAVKTAAGIREARNRRVEIVYR